MEKKTEEWINVLLMNGILLITIVGQKYIHTTGVSVKRNLIILSVFPADLLNKQINKKQNDKSWSKTTHTGVILRCKRLNSFSDHATMKTLIINRHNGNPEAIFTLLLKVLSPHINQLLSSLSTCSSGEKRKISLVTYFMDKSNQTRRWIVMTRTQAPVNLTIIFITTF